MEKSAVLMDTTLPELRESEDNFRFERFLYAKGMVRVAGCDEAGRGPLAGPVVAACVILPTDCDHSSFVDSKILSHQKRLDLQNRLLEIGADFGIGIVCQQTIDEINILRGSLLAMERAVKNISGPAPDFLLVDGKYPVPLNTPQAPLTKGESKSSSIAAASILAKVTRDRIMDEQHQLFPVYNFKQNKGYPTREHRRAIALNGICPIHRKTFRGVKEFVEQPTAAWQKR